MMIMRLFASFIVFGFSTIGACADVVDYRLTDFYAGESTLRLLGGAAQQSISIPLSSNVKVVSSELDIKAISSIALIKKRSMLNIRFNNATIGQIIYDPNKPNINAKVKIPVVLWRSGYNRLTFAVTQHSVEQCAEGEAPELWSEVDLYRSGLKIHLEPSIDRLALEDLSGFFNPGIGGQRNVTIVTPESSSNQLIQHSLSAVAQALALRNHYQPLSVSYKAIPTSLTEQQVIDKLGLQAEPSSDYKHSAWYQDAGGEGLLHVLVGVKDDLAPLVSQSRQNEISGPYLAIEKISEITDGEATIVPVQYRLIVSGLSEEEVSKAASTLALMDDALNPDASITIIGGATEVVSGSQSGSVLHPGYEYHFQDIGVKSETFRGSGSFSKEVELDLPADFYVPENVSVKLLLDFAYGAALGPDSMMNVYVNNVLLHGMVFDNVNGASFHEYQLDIPARYFSGGKNKISFSVTMNKDFDKKACGGINDYHMVFQFLNSSRIILPEAGNVAVQPNLALWASTSYPLIQPGNGVSRIYAANIEVLPAALTLAAKLAQVSGMFDENLEVYTGIPDTLTSNAIVLASPEQLKESLFSTVQASFMATKKWPYRMQNELHNQVRAMFPSSKQDRLKVTSSTEQLSSLGSQAVLLATKNPQSQSDGTLFVITAESTELINQRVNDLISLKLWGQMAGDFFTWENSEEPKLVMQVAERFEVGQESNNWLKLRLWLSNNPAYWLFAVFAVALMIAVLLYLLLKKRQAKIVKEW